MKLSHLCFSLYIGVLVLAANPAEASIYGLMVAHGGNNVKIVYVMENKGPVIQVERENSPLCPIHFYRREGDTSLKAAAGHMFKGKNGISQTDLGLWYDHACYENLEPDSPMGPVVSRFDLYKDVFSQDGFGPLLGDFKNGTLQLGFCLQVPSADGYETREVCSEPISLKTTPVGTVLYQSHFRPSPLIDLGLTTAKPVSPQLRLSEVITPDVPRVGLYKRPSTKISFAQMKLMKADATATWSGIYEDIGGEGAVYYRYDFHNGKIMNPVELEAVLQGDNTFCSIELRVPKAQTSQDSIFLKSTTLPTSGGGGSAQENDYWRLSTADTFEHPFSEDVPQISHFTCSYKSAKWKKNIQIGEVYQHVSINGSSLVKIYSDYPLLQENVSEIPVPREIDRSQIESGLSSGNLPVDDETEIAQISPYTDHWRPGYPSFRVAVAPIDLPASHAIESDSGHVGNDHPDFPDEYSVSYKFAFSKGQLISMDQVMKQIANRQADFCTLGVTVRSVGPSVVGAERVTIPPREATMGGVQYTDFTYHGKKVAIEGSVLNVSKVPKAASDRYAQVDSVSCYGSSRPRSRLSDITRHVQVEGKPLLQSFRTNKISIQRK